MVLEIENVKRLPSGLIVAELKETVEEKTTIDLIKLGSLVLQMQQEIQNKEMELSGLRLKFSRLVEIQAEVVSRRV